MLSWLRKKKYWYRLKCGEELSVIGRFLELLPKVHDASLKRKLKKSLRNIR